MTFVEQFYLWFGLAVGIGLGLFVGYAFWKSDRERDRRRMGPEGL